MSAKNRSNRQSDLRAFIAELRESGDLREINGADWKLVTFPPASGPG